MLVFVMASVCCAAMEKFIFGGPRECTVRPAPWRGVHLLAKGRVYRLHGTGDEFAVILPNYDQSEARATAERIRSAAEQQKPGGTFRSRQVSADLWRPATLRRKKRFKRPTKPCLWPRKRRTQFTSLSRAALAVRSPPPEEDHAKIRAARRT